MITFTKDVNELVCFKDIDGVQDLVHTVVWTLIATDNVTSDFETFGMRTEVPNLDASGFTPFSSLDEQTVLDWIDLFTPTQRIQAAEQYLINTINERKAQTYRAPPWLDLNQGA